MLGSFFLIYVSTPAWKEFSQRRRRKKLIVNNTDDGTTERSDEVNDGVECQHANIAPHNGAEGGLLCHIRDISGESF